MRMVKSMLTLAVLLSAAFGLEAKVTPAPVFSDQMVLQRDRQVPVWGQADPGEEVTVSFAGQTVKGQADRDGKWLLRLEPMAASRENRTFTVSGRANTVTVSNVLVGEVWLAAGQSNMDQPLWGSNPRFRHFDGDKEAAQADFPLIRFVHTPRKWTATPALRETVKWQAVTPQTISPFSAVAYFFGRDLFNDLQVPIGLIGTYWGGTRIEPWTPPVGFDAVPALKSVADAVNAKLPGTAAYRQYNEKALNDYRQWLEKSRTAYEKGEIMTPPPAFPPQLAPPANLQAPTVLYNGMLSRFVPYAVRGAIWYQGCANVNDGYLYYDKMKALLAGWRQVFENPELQFYFVQLAPFQYGKSDAAILPRLWETQERFADSEPAAAMAVINDVGDIKDIHPSDKRTVGQRLAGLALKHTYGRDIKADFPRFEAARAADGKLVLSFRQVESWKTAADQPVANFEVAGLDGEFAPAVATIDGARLIVGSDKVAEPVQLRYCWNKIAEGNLFNEVGLPLGAFRCAVARPDLAEVKAVFPELDADWQLIYRYDLIKGTRKYDLDLAGGLPADPARIGYLLKLTDKEGKETWCFTAFDAFAVPESMGVPFRTEKPFQQYINNLEVATNVAGLKTGTFPSGNIEFWSFSYSAGNQARIPGASDRVYDFGDLVNVAGANPGYGSMQVHNFREKQTVFAFNRLTAKGNADVGIGNQSSGNPDWTFSNSLKNYAQATLHVLLKTR